MVTFSIVSCIFKFIIEFFVEETAAVGNIDRNTVMLSGINDSSSGNLGLEQANYTGVCDKPTLHGFKNRQQFAISSIRPASNSSLSSLQCIDLKYNDLDELKQKYGLSRFVC